jgi:DNA-binding MarR family transcriptional regulator
MFGLLKKQPAVRKAYVHPNSVAAWKAKKPTVSASKINVLRALAELNQPAHYRMISQHLGIMEGSVTPRIKELIRNGYIRVAYVNTGFNRVKVNYYSLTSKGRRFVDQFLEEA